MLAIGDELLSGRTKDRNRAIWPTVLTAAGIDLRRCGLFPMKRMPLLPH